jgi:uncharacterized protein with NRDE domain
MCTVIVGHKLFPRHPLVVAANRDELLDRASEPPADAVIDGYRMIVPRDVQRGGTWIGVNERGVFAAVTNRIDVESVGGMKSRGDLVRRALMMGEDADAAFAFCSRHLDAREYNGFHLVVGDAKDLWVLAGDGKEGLRLPRVHRVTEPGVLIVSNLGIGPDHAPRAEAVMRRWIGRRLARTKPHRATWDALMTIHDPYPKAGAEWMKRMASTCIHRPAEDNYGTKSSAFILLDAAWGAYGAEWRWWHRERADGHNCEARWRPEMRIPVMPPER